MAYLRTRGVVLRCTDYSETSQVVAVCTRDTGQVHLLAKGSRRPHKGGGTPLDLLTHCDLVISRRRAGSLHLLTGWSLRECFPSLRRNLRLFWAAFNAAEVALAFTSENPEDGPVADHVIDLLRRMEETGDARLPLFLFLTQLLKTVGNAPVTEVCAQCRRPLFGRTRFSPAAGGALCPDCAVADPLAFGISRGALAIMARLASRGAEGAAVRVTSDQAMEIQRAFKEQIQYHLGKSLRTARFIE